MKNEEKVKKMLDHLSQAYADPEVKKYPAVQELIFSAAKELENSADCGLTATRLCKKMVLYYWSHQTEFPKALVTLHKQIKPEAVKYDGIALLAMLLPAWF
jgi:hypothetical protein